MSQKQLLVIGGGAAGFFCAINAAKLNRNLKVTILEKTGKLLSKVKVSGGGRCNVTHQCDDMDAMTRQYPRGGRFLKKAFHHFFTHDTVSWFAERGVKLVAESDGRMFPESNKSQTIIDCFISEMNRYGIALRLHTSVSGCIPSGHGWTVLTEGGECLQADYLCVACGGPANMERFRWLKETGHTVIEPVPSLFTFNLAEHPFRNLMGIAVDPATVKITGTRYEETGPVLITHWGFSGPAVLRLSAWGARELAAREYRFGITINWCPGFHQQSMKVRLLEERNSHGSQVILQRNSLGLPSRLWSALGESAGIKAGWRWSELPAAVMNRFCQILCQQTFEIKGKTTFKEEFVTAGGIDCREINPHTMQSRLHAGLFFAGEIMDVDGITGGYNFQHAWTSGFLAAKAIAQMAG